MRKTSGYLLHEKRKEVIPLFSSVEYQTNELKFRKAKFNDRQG